MMIAVTLRRRRASWANQRWAAIIEAAVTTTTTMTTMVMVHAFVVLVGFLYFVVSCVCHSLCSYKMAGEYFITNSSYVGSA